MEGWMIPENNKAPADALLTIGETAADLKCSESYLAKGRMNGTGPEYITLGRPIRYRRSALEAYKAARTRTSTSQHRKASLPAEPRQNRATRPSKKSVAPHTDAAELRSP